MTEPHEDDWRAIVENFGDAPDPERIAAEVIANSPPAPPEPILEWSEPAEEDGYVPPPPPPLPDVPGRVRLAWACLLGGPALLLVCLFVGYRPPTAVVFAGLAAIVFSLVFLIFRSPRTPREPWEDGAQI